ncbi:MAG: histidine kinase, partial [Bacteroidales bacterium]
MNRFLIRQLRDVLILFAISIFVTYFYQGNRLFESLQNLFTGSLYGFVVGFTIWKGSQAVGYLLRNKFTWEQNPGRAFAGHLSISFTYAAIAIILVNWIYHSVASDSSFSFRNRHIVVEMVVEMGITLFINTLYYSRQFFIFWRKSAINEEKYKQEAMQLQYETLKSYVNPHFLFNSLSVLSSLVEKDTQKSQLFIRQLSDIYRYVLEQKGKELVSLETELDFARSFINLHKIRHGENLNVELDINDSSGYIVPLSMQILLENAFKHNVISEEEPLVVKVWRDHDYIIVQNQIRKKKTIEARGG